MSGDLLWVAVAAAAASLATLLSTGAVNSLVCSAPEAALEAAAASFLDSPFFGDRVASLKSGWLLRMAYLFRWADFSTLRLSNRGADVGMAGRLVGGN